MVLVYHDFVPERDAHALWFDCTPSEFKGQIRWLRSKGAHFVTVDQLYSHLRSGAKLPKHPVVMTFADNYEGFYKWALPILRKEQIPGAQFVHTDYVGNRTGRPKMTWTQLRELDSEGLVSIYSQTRTHPADLTAMTDAQVSAEFVGSKRVLELRLGHPNPYLAYPNGKFDARIASDAQRAGYKMAFTEAQHPAEAAPNIYEVARYVHVRYRKAWSDCNSG